MRHRLYAVHFGTKFALSRNGRRARQFARKNAGLCVSMPLPEGGGAWDWPTFYACADRVEVDYRPKEKK